MSRMHQASVDTKMDSIGGAVGSPVAHANTAEGKHDSKTEEHKIMQDQTHRASCKRACTHCAVLLRRPSNALATLWQPLVWLRTPCTELCKPSKGGKLVALRPIM